MIRSRLLATVCCALALAACEPPPDDVPPAGPGAGDGDAGGAGPGGGDPGGGGPGGGDAPAEAAPAVPSLTLSFAPGEAPEGASAVEVEIVALALFDRPAPWRDADTPCDGGGAGALVAHAARVEVGFGGGERVPIIRLEPAGGGELREVWLVVRAGVLRTQGGGRPVHAERLCLMPDGRQYTVLRARPGGGGVALDGDREVALELGRGQLRADRVDCRDAPGLEECAAPGDDDGGDDTRLYYRFAGELPARVVE